MVHDLSSVTIELPEAYASALEYAAAQLSLDQGEAVVMLIQLACIAEVDGKLLDVGRQFYNWLTIVKQVPTEEVWLDRR